MCVCVRVCVCRGGGGGAIFTICCPLKKKMCCLVHLKNKLKLKSVLTFTLISVSVVLVNDLSLVSHCFLFWKCV